MQKVAAQIVERVSSPKWRPAISVALALIAIAIAGLFWPPQRSTEAFCKIWNQDQKQLRTKDSVSYAADYEKFFAKLERVAPDDIRNDVHVEKMVFQKIAKDPTQAMSAGLSGLSAGSNVDTWSRQHCQQNK